jgi:hypothetical protein
LRGFLSGGSAGKEAKQKIMIKKPTLIVLVCAILLGGAVYYFQWRSSKSPKPSEDKSKAAFSVQAGDITSLTILHPGKTDQPTIQLASRNGTWDITQPLETGADQSAVNGITDGLASARVSQNEPGTPDRLKVYGLDSPRLELDFQLKSGAKHKVLIGDKDFTGASVYSLIDNAKEVSLLPISLYDSADKSVQDLRDRSVLHISSEKTDSLELNNPSGELALSKKTVNDQAQWDFTKPSDAHADEDNVNALLSAVSSGSFSSVVSEKAESLGKYGLVNPTIRFTAENNAGEKQTLLVGKKGSGGYFARDDSRPTIFVINEDLYKKLSQSFGDLRDKDLVHLKEGDVNRIDLRNTNGTMAMVRKPGSDFDWTVESPANLKGKSAAGWKVFSPLTSARADEIIDRPSAGILAKFTKPAVEVDLTDKNGKKLTVKLSGPDGGFVYGQTSASPSIYKLKKSILNDLNFKSSDLAS